MKKLFLFMVLMLASWMGVMGEEITLQLTGSDPTDGEWAYRKVTNYAALQAGDKIVATYATTEGKYCQLSLGYGNASNTIITAHVDNSTTTWSYTLTEGNISKISTEGMAIGYQWLTNFSIKAVRGENTGGSTEPTEPDEPVIDDTYKPNGAIAYTYENIDKKIENWYGEENVYRLKIADASSHIGKILRVVCDGTGYDAYAFLKYGSSWTPIMSGADKFSIAGWKYFEITINAALAGYLSDSDNGLIIGGNNYTIKAAYIYGDGTTAPAWSTDDNDIINRYSLSIAGTAGWGHSQKVPGSFFEYIYNNGEKTNVKIPNTRNNIIRLCFDGTATDAELTAAASGDETNGFGSYIRYRKPLENNSFQYQDYVTVNDDHYDFELSDAITVFHRDGDSKVPVLGETGTLTGMLSTLLKDSEGMNIDCNRTKITEIQIRKSMISKYVSGYAVYTGHHLSATDWRTVALPYNLTADQIKETFGADARICELGASKVTKEATSDGTFHYGITLNFEKIASGAGMNANYPYMVKLASSGVKADDNYVIADVKADVRDFQSYEFRTSKFDLTALDATMPDVSDADYNQKKTIFDYEEGIRAKLTDDVRMIFKSTAPVFKITNKDVGNVEVIQGVENDGRTILNIPSNNSDATNYYLYDNTLYPVLTQTRRLASGLAYVVFPSATKNLFDTSVDGTPQEAKMHFVFDHEGETTGVDEVQTANAQKFVRKGIYGLDGRLVRNGQSIEGLAKGIYVVDGKKILVK